MSGIDDRRRHSTESVAKTIEDLLSEWLRSDECRRLDLYGRVVRLTMNTGQTFDVTVVETTASSKEASELQPGDVIEWCGHACTITDVREQSHGKLLIDVHVNSSTLDESARHVNLHYDSSETVKLLHLSGRP